jgi:hypothetical protein
VICIPNWVRQASGRPAGQRYIVPARRDVWFLIETGIRGVLVPDEKGIAVCYMSCEPASHYYRIMTVSARMPVLIDQRI